MADDTTMRFKLVAETDAFTKPMEAAAAHAKEVAGQMSLPFQQASDTMVEASGQMAWGFASAADKMNKTPLAEPIKQATEETQKFGISSLFTFERNRAALLEAYKRVIDLNAAIHETTDTAKKLDLEKQLHAAREAMMQARLANRGFGFEMLETRERLMAMGQMASSVFGVQIPAELMTLLARLTVVQSMLSGLFMIGLAVGAVTMIKDLGEKLLEWREHAEKVRQKMIELDATHYTTTSHMQDELDKQDQKILEITAGSMAAMAYGWSHMGDVGVQAVEKITAVMEKDIAILKETEGWTDRLADSFLRLFGAETILPSGQFEKMRFEMLAAATAGAKAHPENPLAGLTASGEVAKAKLDEVNEKLKSIKEMQELPPASEIEMTTELAKQGAELEKQRVTLEALVADQQKQLEVVERTRQAIEEQMAARQREADKALAESGIAGEEQHIKARYALNQEGIARETQELKKAEDERSAITLKAFEDRAEAVARMPVKTDDDRKAQRAAQLGLATDIEKAQVDSNNRQAALDATLKETQKSLARAHAEAMISANKGLTESQIKIEEDGAKRQFAIGLISRGEMLNAELSANGLRQDAERTALGKRLEEARKMGEKGKAQYDALRTELNGLAAKWNNTDLEAIAKYNNDVEAADRHMRETLSDNAKRAADTDAAIEIARINRLASAHQTDAVTAANQTIIEEDKKFIADRQDLYNKAAELAMSPGAANDPSRVIAVYAQIEDMEKKHQDRDVAIAFEGGQKQLDEEKRRISEQSSIREASANRELAMEVMLNSGRLKRHEETLIRWAASERDAIERWYAEQLAATTTWAEEVKRIYGETSVEYQRVLDRELALTQEYAGKIEALEQRMATARQQSLEKWAGGFNNTLVGLTTTEGNVTKAFLNLWLDVFKKIEASWLTSIENMAASKLSAKLGEGIFGEVLGGGILQRLGRKSPTIGAVTAEGGVRRPGDVGPSDRDVLAQATSSRIMPNFPDFKGSPANVLATAGTTLNSAGARLIEAAAMLRGLKAGPTGGEGEATTSGGGGEATTSGGGGEATTSGGDGEATTSGGEATAKLVTGAEKLIDGSTSLGSGAQSLLSVAPTLTDALSGLLGGGGEGGGGLLSTLMSFLPLPFRDGGLVQHFPLGGPVRGAGTATSDSVPAQVSAGEYVVNAAAVNKVGVGAMDDINAGRSIAMPAKIGAMDSVNQGRPVTMPGALRELPAPSTSATSLRQMPANGPTFNFPTHIGNLNALDGASVRKALEEHGDLIGKIAMQTFMGRFRTINVV